MSGACSVSSERRSGPYQFFMLLLCVYVLIALCVETFAGLDENAQVVLAAIDTAICFIFLADFIHSLARAPNRPRYLVTWGWIDLISSIPMIGFLRWGRAARVVRILRVLRGVRSAKVLSLFALERRAEWAFLSTVFVAILAMVFSSIAIMQLETSEDVNIGTPEEALWWAFVTITTVGYGDYYPVTTEGRILAAVLMAVGVGLFGTFTAFVASWLLGKAEPQGDPELKKIRTELQEIRELLRAGALRDGQ